MPSAYNLHPESRYSCLSPKLHHKLGLVLAFIAFGSVAAASGVVLQMAGHKADSNGSRRLLRLLSTPVPRTPSVSPRRLLPHSARRRCRRPLRRKPRGSLQGP